MFEKQRKWFERWVLEQFKEISKEMLARDYEGYEDKTINNMFISFCAGWQFRDFA